MERLTQRDGAGEYHLAEGAGPAEAARRLGAFEDFYLDLEDLLEKLAGQLEALRAAGKKNSVKFRELFAKKLTAGSTLALLKTYGLGAEK